MKDLQVDRVDHGASQLLQCGAAAAAPWELPRDLPPRSARTPPRPPPPPRTQRNGPQPCAEARQPLPSPAAGVRCLDDPQLVAHLEETQVALTVCPLSNLCLQVGGGGRSAGQGGAGEHLAGAVPSAGGTAGTQDGHTVAHMYHTPRA